MADDGLLEVYKQLNVGYQAVDDFRAKLLGFLPLATGAAFFGLFNTPGFDHAKMSPYLSELGLLGSLITFGLLIYELKGIQKCTSFIDQGAAIEEKLACAPSGKFSALKGRKGLWLFINEPVASAIIYSSVIAGWVYVATCTRTIDGIVTRRDNWTPVLCTAIGVFIGIYLFWLYCAVLKRDKKKG